ncbi:uncharacterized protein AAEQ78_014846 [Lycaon pictus]
MEGGQAGTLQAVRRLFGGRRLDRRCPRLRLLRARPVHPLHSRGTDRIYRTSNIRVEAEKHKCTYQGLARHTSTPHPSAAERFLKMSGAPFRAPALHEEPQRTAAGGREFRLQPRKRERPGTQHAAGQRGGFTGTGHGRGVHRDEPLLDTPCAAGPSRRLSSEHSDTRNTSDGSALSAGRGLSEEACVPGWRPPSSCPHGPGGLPGRPSSPATSAASPTLGRLTDRPGAGRAGLGVTRTTCIRRRAPVPQPAPPPALPRHTSPVARAPGLPASAPCRNRVTVRKGHRAVTALPRAHPGLPPPGAAFLCFLPADACSSGRNSAKFRL